MTKSNKDTGGESRLDRLLTLLQTGSSMATRKAAAQQIGELQKAHPHDLQALVRKVHVLLRHKEWDTRVAAGYAIEAIAKVVPDWRPGDVDPADVDMDPIPPPALSFETFDAEKVLNGGRPLTASGGQEYDIDFSGMDRATRLAVQRRNLIRRLGLDDFGGDDVAAIIDDDDLDAGSGSASRKRKRSDGKDDDDDDDNKASAAEAVAALETAGMSARERNRAKREAKRKAAEKANTYRGLPEVEEPAAKRARTKTVVTDQPQDESKVVIEAVVDETIPVLEGEWPFELICDELCHDLFDPVWEVRHGAAVGLREVLKFHAKGAGRTVGRTPEDSESQNAAWLEDCCLRLLCVEALDRFGDYVGDQVVAPVRATCAQVLGVLLTHMSREAVYKMVEALLRLQLREQWEIRHGGMLGLKYIVVVRTDLVSDWLPLVLPAAIRGLRDADDDVRAVAADALVPLTEKTLALLPRHAAVVVSLLWDALLYLDDLTVSTAAVIGLLAQFYALPGAAASIAVDLDVAELDGPVLGDEPGAAPPSPPPADEQAAALTVLVPRLWPFMRHALATVRGAALRTVQQLLGGANVAAWLTPIASETLRHLYQSFLIESDSGVAAVAEAVWRSVLDILPAAALADAAGPYLADWLALLTTPAGHKLDNSLLLVSHHSRAASESSKAGSKGGSANGNGKAKGSGSAGATATTSTSTTTGGADGSGDGEADGSGSTGGGDEWQDALSLGATETSVRMRVSGAMALGILASRWPADRVAEVSEPLRSLLVGNSAICCQCSCLVLEEWARAARENVSPADRLAGATPPGGFDAELTAALAAKGGCRVAGGYVETAAAQKRLHAEAKALVAAFVAGGLDPAAAAVFPLESPPTLENAAVLATTLFAQWTAALPQTRVEEPAKARSAQRHALLATLSYIQTAEAKVNCGVAACAAGVVVTRGARPAKLTPVIRALMGAVQNEDSELLQERAASALAELLALNDATGKAGANAKVIDNLCAYACFDRTVTPTAAASDEPILFAPVVAGGESGESGTDAPVDAAALKAGKLTRRGAVAALRAAARQFGDELFTRLPALWERLSGGLAPAAVEAAVTATDLVASAQLAQATIDTLDNLAALAPALSPACIEAVIASLLGPIVGTVRARDPAIRLVAARALSELAAVSTLPVMEALIESLLPLLGVGDDATTRRGAALAVKVIVERLDLAVLPYIVFLIVPILGRMSDQDPPVRETVTNTFAQLTKLMPLEAGVDDPEGMAAELVARKKVERRFLEQLLDPSQLDRYEVAVKVHGELRSYQQAGVDWMAFLNKYNLHGILCDDMGLGKTLQTLVMVASDSAARAAAHAANPTPDTAPLHSLVVCPTTVVAHWFYEVGKFFDDGVLAPVMYVGKPADRRELQAQIHNHELIILSYDVLRNDIEFLETLTFNYCVLDEGHIIKNPKTKVSQAARRIRANHRLILSGTPIQNSPLELWALFAFLMPGFLWTEAEFNRTYGKPIMASRDGKASDKEAEAGALALEALHRQVLPFLLRRMKEDVLHDLPPKIIQDYYCELSPLQVSLYEGFARTTLSSAVAGSGGDDGSGDDEEGDGADGSNANADEGAAVDADGDVAMTDAGATTTTTTTTASGGKGSSGSGSKASDSKGKAKAKRSGASGHIFQALNYMRRLCSHPSLVLKPQHPDYSAVLSDLAARGSSIRDIAHAPKMQALKNILNECGIGLGKGGSGSGGSGGSGSGKSKGKGAASETDVINEAVAGHRVLVFAQLKEVLDIIEEDVFKRAMGDRVTYMRLDGGTPASQRQAVVNRFNADVTIDVLLLTTHVGGLGLNLQSADTVVFMEHDWNPMKDLQAMDRAHRIGQKNVVTVYRLITKGTLEEKIMGLQRFKLNIANTVVSSENASLRGMNTSNLLDLFALDSDGGQRSGKGAAGGSGTGAGDGSDDVAMADAAGAVVDGSSGGKGKGKKKKKSGLQAVIADLEELWEEDQYVEEYDVTKFVASLPSGAGSA